MVSKADSGHTVLQYILLWSADWLILHSVYACFSLRFCLYQGVILRVSGPDMYSIAC